MKPEPIIPNPKRYSGRWCLKRMAEDIRQATRNGLEELIANHPSWLDRYTPDEARALVGGEEV